MRWIDPRRRPRAATLAPATVSRSLRRHPLRFAGLIAVALVLVVVTVRTAWDDPGSGPIAFGDRVPGQRIYDRTGLLSAGQIAAIDRRAEAIERSGVPVVVYIREPASGAIDTRSAARQLMQVWDVESAPGAEDGLVLLLDIERDAERDGDVALVAGDELRASRLPARETERIASDTVAWPALSIGATDQLVAGIGSGLAATELRLVLGVPPAPAPSLGERLVVGFVQVPLAALSILLGLAALISVGVLWWHRPRIGSDAVASEAPVADISDALRAALAANRVDADVVAVVIRDLVRSGAVAHEDPDDAWDGAPRGGLRLVDGQRVSGPIARALWADLAATADAGGRVTPAAVAHVSRHPVRLAAVIATDLERHGLWDPTAARRAAPLRVLGQVLAAVGGVGLILGLVAGDPMALWSVALLAIAAAVAWGGARAYPRSTPRGLAVTHGR